MTAASDTAADTTEWQNLFGVCACIGEDFGFNPLWLRIAFAAPLIWRPDIVVAVYLALGIVVLSSRLIFPKRKYAGAARTRFSASVSASGTATPPHPYALAA